jgi:1-phosphatidylinositol-4-phosphate 5-kinase
MIDENTASRMSKGDSDDDDRSRSKTSRSGAGSGGDANGKMYQKKKSTIGHTKMEQDVILSYKAVPMQDLVKSIQLGIQVMVSDKHNDVQRYTLMKDFEEVKSLRFPKEGVNDCSNSLPAHGFEDFRFKAYAPQGFKFFRDIYKVDLSQFLNSVCGQPMHCVSNPGASGSLFFISNDDCFILKTLQKKESDFLLQLFPGYFLNLYQNKNTLLPKFYGLYCYQALGIGKNIRIAVMNNLLPNNVQLFEKFDLKGSTYKRRASRKELEKKCPTLKDLDFKEKYRGSHIYLKKEIYNALMSTLENDARMLESFAIMDYSFLLGVEKVTPDTDIDGTSTLRGRGNLGNKVKPTYYNFAEDLQIKELSLSKGIPAYGKDKEPLRLYVGIIDILQKYEFKKKLEHAFKAAWQERENATVSVTKPHHYMTRFLSFMRDEVFAVHQEEEPARSKYLHPSSSKKKMSISGHGRNSLAGAAAPQLSGAASSRQQPATSSSPRPPGSTTGASAGASSGAGAPIARQESLAIPDDASPTTPTGSAPNVFGMSSSSHAVKSQPVYETVV